MPFARGEKKVALHASNAQTILAALKFSKDLGLESVLYGASERWKSSTRPTPTGWAAGSGPATATSEPTTWAG